MSDKINSDADFESRLRREVERVLADPAFQRSPVQSRLLAYLCEQTIARNRNISQMAVAVDGLGRPENADQLTESYPRVQISRLRRNLSLYYARCAPGEGLAVFIRTGDYQLRLAPPDSAYGEQRRRSAQPAAPANDVTDPLPAAPPARARTPLAKRWRLAALGGAIAVLLAAALWFYQGRSGPAGAAIPTLDIRVEETPGAGGPDPLLALAAQQADDIASNSYVVRNPNPQDRPREPDYTLRIRPSQSLEGRGVLEVSLFDRENQRLFNDGIPIDDDRAAVLTRLNGALLQMFNPAGLIAVRELAGLAGQPQTDYQCVLMTEADRLQGGLTTVQVEDCLQRFPESGFRAYWFSRMAFMGYRNRVLAGGEVEASGEPWSHLQQALAADSTNPFANYMAAKVNFSRGDCAAARPFFERTLANGNYSGVLTAATVSEATLCPDTLTPDHAAGARLVSLVEAIPDPNPLLYAYLVFATAAVDRPDLARRLLASRPSEDPHGSMADIHEALRTGLGSPAEFAANRDRLQRVVDGFYWEAGTRQRMMGKLEAVAGYSG